jgi:hypothetical protein
MSAMKERQSNFELLRILLMCTIPVFHLMVYNGVCTVNNTNAILALVLSVGGAIPADYAFMALSVYFFLEAKERPVVKRFLLLAVQVLTLYLIKVVVLRSLFGYHNTEYFIDFFLMKGAWWYIYPYLLLSLVYPLLNRIIRTAGKWQLYLITGCLFLVFCWQGIYNQGNFLQDCVAFLFTYFLFGCLKRQKYTKFLGISTKKRNMAVFVLLCYALLLFMGMVAKLQCFGMEQSVAESIIAHIIGRYHLLSALMGYGVFFFFRDLKMACHPWINALAKVTFYVFLLHDTWLGVFWYFGKCANDYGYYPLWEFVLWLILYLVSTFIIAALMGWVYGKWLEPLWRVLVDNIYGMSWVQKMEGVLCQTKEKHEIQ